MDGSVLNGVLIVLYIDVYPHHPGNTENVDKVNREENTQQGKGYRLAPFEEPVEKSDEKQAEPARPDIGNKHGAVIVPRLRKVI
jgi:hypothetical protein